MLVLSLVFMALLAVLSLVGAFLGAERAAAFFNASGMAAFWILLAGLLVLAMIYHDKLPRAPASLTLHLGPVLILVGAMWGSTAGHRLAEKVLDIDKTPRGFMKIDQGEAGSTVYAHADFDPQAGLFHLPFSLYLREFTLEHYPLRDPRWKLTAVMLPGPDAPPDAEVLASKIPWREGQDVEMPFTAVRLRILQYLDSAEPVYAEGAAPHLEVASGEQATPVVLKLEAGQTARLRGVTVRVAHVFANPKMVGLPPEGRVIDAGGSASNPAANVDVEWADGRKESRFVMARFAMHGQKDDHLRISCVAPEPIGNRAAPPGNPPAMELLLTCDGREKRTWLVPGPVDDRVLICPAKLLEPEGNECTSGVRGYSLPYLCLAKPTPMIRDYKSDLIVIDESRQVCLGHKVVEVNDPLHYGGYHFYQTHYDEEEQQFTILSVVSDTGLPLVYGGFVVMTAAAFWRCWGQPAWRYLRRRSDHGA